MAWEHSYVPEAYDLARAELETWTREALAEALAEYNYGKFHGDPPWRPGNPHYRGGWTMETVLHPRLAHDILVDACMDAIMDVYTCDNGGWAMWIDFDGYHKVVLGE